MLVEQKKQKIGTAVNAMREENLSACHFGHVCHRFTSPALECDCMKPMFNLNMGKLEIKVPYNTNNTGNACVFTTLSHKWYNIQKKIIAYKMRVLISSTQVLSKTILILKRIHPKNPCFSIICAPSSPC